MKQILRFVFAASLCAALTYCGFGGGGGGDSSSPSAATVSIDAQPRFIDSGDRTTVTVRVEDVNDLGIGLKIRFPSGLKFITNSAHLVVDDVLTSLTATVNKTSGTSTYVVFYFTREDFGDGNFGKVTLVLQGTSAVNDELIEVDADVDDPSVSNSTEFSITDPKFDAQDEVGITVDDGSASSGTPTPTPTP